MISREQLLAQIKSSVLATDPDATVILYGSYARGDYHADSDIDILVLLDKEKITMNDRDRIGPPLYYIGLWADMNISPVFRARKKWETEHAITPFYKNVTREGIVL